MERVFSRIFGIWTDDKSQLSVESLRAVISVDYNLNMKGKDSHDYIPKKSKVLMRFILLASTELQALWPFSLQFVIIRPRLLEN